MHACMHACIYVCMHVCMDFFICCIDTHAMCVGICMYLAYVCRFVYVWTIENRMSVCVFAYACMYAYVLTHKYACMHARMHLGVYVDG